MDMRTIQVIANSSWNLSLLAELVILYFWALFISLVCIFFFLSSFNNRVANFGYFVS